MRTDIIAWVDVETTGLDPHNSNLLEVAIIPTTWDLVKLHRGLTMPIKVSTGTVDGLRDSCDPVVKSMHDATGLWDRLGGPTARHLPEVDTELRDYISYFAPKKRQARLGGNSVRLDLNFAERFLPEFYSRLHYRFFDVSGLQEAASQWYEVPAFEKRLEHSALADIEESIAQARFLRNALRAA